MTGREFADRPSPLGRAPTLSPDGVKCWCADATRPPGARHASGEPGPRGSRPGASGRGQRGRDFHQHQRQGVLILGVPEHRGEGRGLGQGSPAAPIAAR